MTNLSKFVFKMYLPYNWCSSGICEQLLPLQASLPASALSASEDVSSVPYSPPVLHSLDRSVLVIGMCCVVLKHYFITFVNYAPSMGTEENYMPFSKKNYLLRVLLRISVYIMKKTVLLDIMR